ncbi:uncharacterized protein HMPREF1541_07966 [Cyphellophora europaea CBS 101466]|uniref:Uncharacterized protein n=1 Tax=Cyphellophora europaea (strain CBS 101466) TaxID=1220924 RepID=W2RMQ4_CYPE1|nr:uncharacterized protein HMPREF1541_07966 [Cyphellophora europaea CBS 101466]ETN36978.1 hypothetical protein HMPREF1541_07966 [Cyphellophora europaea CBS 101466]
MPPHQSQQPAAPTVPQGPNHQLNVLRQLLDTQVKAEATLAGTDDRAPAAALKEDINRRKAPITEEFHDFLHDPFTNLPASDFTDPEKHALRRLRAAIVSVMEQSSESNKKELKAANMSLVRLMGPDEQ